jgi:predicted SAM-dependent methyltransferase
MKTAHGSSTLRQRAAGDVSRGERAKNIVGRTEVAESIDSEDLRQEAALSVLFDSAGSLWNVAWLCQKRERKETSAPVVQSMEQPHSQHAKDPLRHFVARAKSLVKSRIRPQLSRARNSSAALDRSFCPDIPQASVLEENLECFEQRDWRKYFSDKLRGRGLEIGPLHRPLQTHPGMNVEYVDRHTVAELRAEYPELRELPLVEPHIISDAETLRGVPDASYDFLISAHVIEHMKSPLSALESWFRVLKPGGLLYLIVPDKRATFDVRRVRTTLGHIVLDYYQPSAERDFEHYLDYAIHVQNAEWHTMLQEARRLAETDYSIHFHVFLPSDVLNLLRWFSKNIRPIEILEGPNMAPGSDEFHFLLRLPS